MRTLKDKDGNTWHLPALCTGLLTDLREQAGFVIGDSKGKTREQASKDASELLLSLYDPFTLGAVLWVLLGKQAERRDLDERAFGYCFTSNEYEAARYAIIGALVDFRHPPALAAEILNAMPGVVLELENRLIAVWKSFATDSVGSSESTRDR